jgi:hypothetical protein
MPAMPAVPDALDSLLPHPAAPYPAPARALLEPRQMVVQGLIPTYYNLSGPAPGTVVGIVLGSVAGFLLIVWLLMSLTQGGGRGAGTTTTMAGEEEIVVRKRRNSHGNRSRRSAHTMHEQSRSPRLSGTRSQIVVDERRAPRPRSILVEERRRVPNDDVVEVIEEHDDYHERRASRRGGYR